MKKFICVPISDTQNNLKRHYIDIKSITSVRSCGYGTVICTCDMREILTVVDISRIMPEIPCSINMDVYDDYLIMLDNGVNKSIR